MPETAVLIVLAVLIAFLVGLTVRLGRSDFSQFANRMAKKTRDGFEVLKPCPLCATLLKQGETVRSEVFSTQSAREAAKRSGRIADHLAHIHGCRYCYPANSQYPRICPVCSARLGNDDYVIARMFDRSTRTHVHVLGCSQCRMG